LDKLALGEHVEAPRFDESGADASELPCILLFDSYVGFDIRLARMSPRDKPLVWLRGKVKTPPFGSVARIEAGFLLRRLQRGENLALPHSRPMPDIGAGCHELRVVDGPLNWRIMYHVAPDAIVILDVFAKKTAATPKRIIAQCRQTLTAFRKASHTKGGGHARR
jgi:phage-related protein